MPALLHRNQVDDQFMVLIPAGPAVFGSAQDDLGARDDEKPQFEAEVGDYYLGIYSVTNAQYAQFLSAVRPSESDVEQWIWLSGSSCHVERAGG